MNKRLPLVLALSSALFACAEEEDGGPDYTQDASSALPGDAALPTYDASLSFDASLFPSDAALPFDAGSSSDAALPTDAGAPDGSTDAAARDAGADASAPRDGGTDSGVVNGNLCPGSATPHGCYKAKAGNDPSCPAQIYEQSAFYPPPEEWKGCASPLYQACVYLRPDGSEANCSCDFGLHWLCTY